MKEILVYKSYELVFEMEKTLGIEVQLLLCSGILIGLHIVSIQILSGYYR